MKKENRKRIIVKAKIVNKLRYAFRRGKAVCLLLPLTVPTVTEIRDGKFE